MKLHYTIALQLLFLSIFSISVNAQSGPGGVGNTSTNGLWLKADDINQNTGTAVSIWSDVSGNDNHAEQNTSSEQPVYHSSSVLNGMPIVRLDGTDDYLLIDDDDILDGTISIAFYTVVRPTNLDNNPRGILGKRVKHSNLLTYSYSWFFFSNNKLHLDVNNTLNRLQTGWPSFSNNNNYIVSWDFDGTLPTTSRMRIHKANVITTGPKNSTYVKNTTSPLTIGTMNQGYDYYLGGDFAEIIHFNYAPNTAEHIIVQNYLSAKYDILINANDRYAGDDPANGDYDKNVIGIGAESSGSHTESIDSKGLNIKLNSGSVFSAGDYLFAGNNVPVNESIFTDIAGVTGLEARWKRIWYFDKTGTGSFTTDITFDISEGGFSGNAGVASNYKLLYRAGTTGNWTDAGTATSVSGDKILFDNNSLSNGDGYYTIGTLDFINSPLPIELTKFEVNVTDKIVNIFWQTATETDNDYFTIERSNNGKDWEDVAQIKGAGSSSKLRNYTSIDRNPRKGISYYRLKQTDFDGAFSFSMVRMVEFRKNELKVIPNPTQNYVRVSMGNSNNIGLHVYNLMGQDVSERVVISRINDTEYKLDLSALPNGVYYIRSADSFAKVYKQ